MATVYRFLKRLTGRKRVKRGDEEKNLESQIAAATQSGTPSLCVSDLKRIIREEEKERGCSVGGGVR